MKRFFLAALLLSACASSPKVHEVKCLAWAAKGEPRMVMLEALTTDFTCAERICWGLSDGHCYYGCPQERMPEVCR